MIYLSFLVFYDSAVSTKLIDNLECKTSTVDLSFMLLPTVRMHSVKQIAHGLRVFHPFLVWKKKNMLLNNSYYSYRRAEFQNIR